MAHFAELGDSNVVLRVIVVSNDDAGPLPGVRGEAFCHDLLGGRWKQTSYNTRGNVHYDPVTNQPDAGEPFRANYACVGGTYDAERDVFIPPSPGPEFVLNTVTYVWEEPWQP